MKANELRIANRLLHVSKGIIEVGGTKPHCGDCMIVLEDGWVYLKNCSPIPLTEEWLFKFGFEKVDVDTYFKQYYLENQGLRVHWFEGWICYQGFINNWNELTIVRHVHQLQNLYFALTGEELTIKQHENA